VALGCGGRGRYYALVVELEFVAEYMKFSIPEFSDILRPFLFARGNPARPRHHRP
jgi:hypothetical protein